MDYVNSPPSSPGSAPPGSAPHLSSPPPRQPLIEWQAVAQLFKQLPYQRLRAWFVLGFAAVCAALVILLALSPPYEAFSTGLDLQPARLFAPLTTYLFRNAVINTLILWVAVYLLAFTFGWTWAVTGVPQTVRPFLLVPLFIPGALVGLLWRPLFSGWLDLAQAELSLLVIGLVLLWRAVPLAAWVACRDRDAWPQSVALCALLVLLDGDLVLTLTGGEPFNGSHIWMSWLVQQLWTQRAWGYAASMAGALALVVAMMALWARHDTPAPVFLPHGSPLGHATAYLWLLGPFILPLYSLAQAPGQAASTLMDAGVLRWLLNGALLWAGTTWLASRLAWPVRGARARSVVWPLTVAMLPLATVALGYLAHTLPFLRGLWLLWLAAGLFTGGLLMGDDPISPNLAKWRRAAGYAAFVLAHIFPLQLVLHLPGRAWTPTLGTVWTLAEAPHATAALSAMLLLFGVWAGLGAWMVARPPVPDPQQSLLTRTTLPSL